MTSGVGRTRRLAGDILAIPVAVGLATGVLEGLLLLFRRFGLGLSIWAPVDIIWMAPLTYAVAALPLALAALTLHRWRPDLVTPSRVAGLMGFLGGLVLSANLFGTRMQWIAHLSLAAAAGVQFFRLSSGVAPRFPDRARRSIPFLAGGTVAAALVMLASHQLQGRPGRVTASPPPANAPNILLIIWDTVRAQNVSLLGYGRPTTPNLERWAAHGTVFEQAMSTAPWTLASHASAFTGLHTQELGAEWRTPLQTHAPTLAEYLGAHGYRTAGFVANLIATSRESGLARGFSLYDDFPRTLQTVYTSTLLGQRLQRWRPFFRGDIRLYPPRPAHHITDRFLDWSNSPGRPWFAFLNYFDAHDPYFPPEDYRSRFKSDDPLIDKYDGAIHLLDAELDRLLRTLRDRGELETTIVILVSDHGEQFGEHGLRQHGNSLYIQLLHVPLVLWGPGIPAGARVATPVSLRSLPATLVELAVPGSDHPFPGGSLVSAWQDSPQPEVLLAGVPKGVNTQPNEPVTLGNMSAVREGELHYILNGDGRRELYDLGADPPEEHDLAGDSTVAAARIRLDHQLHELVPDTWHTPTTKGQTPR